MLLVWYLGLFPMVFVFFCYVFWEQLLRLFPMVFKIRNVLL